MHEIANRPMLEHVLRSSQTIGCDPIVTVAGPNMLEVEAFGQAFGKSCIQHNQRGTADAVLAAQESLKGFSGHMLVLYGDTPLIKENTLRKMLTAISEPDTAVAVLGFTPDEAGAYGRLIMGDGNSLERIVEAKDASADELAVTFCNSGVIALNGMYAWELLGAVDDNNAAGEFT